MTMLFEELKDELKRWPETDLVELLNLSSEELVETFSDLIYDKQDELRRRLELDEEKD